MIKLINILKEIDIQKKVSLGSGEQQIAYPYVKDPNYVIKMFDPGTQYAKKSPYVLDRYEIKHYLQILKQHPECVANIIIPNENSKYYLQEKVNVKKAQNDIWDVVVEVIKKVTLDLENKYETPYDAYEHSETSVDLFLNAKNWEVIKNIKNIDDIFEITYGEGIPMDYLFDDYIYENYSKNIPLVQKLKPVWEVGRRYTQYGSFHEDNLGYDSNGNFKIIDL